MNPVGKKITKNIQAKLKKKKKMQSQEHRIKNVGE